MLTVPNHKMIILPSSTMYHQAHSIKSVSKDKSRTIDSSTHQEVIEPRIELFQLLGIEFLKDHTLDGEEFLMTILKVLE
jgi:hypothetical protein